MKGVDRLLYRDSRVPIVSPLEVLLQRIILLFRIFCRLFSFISHFVGDGKGIPLDIRLGRWLSRLSLLGKCTPLDNLVYHLLHVLCFPYLRVSPKLSQPHGYHLI